jgi:uncharacterized protein YqeY
MLIDQLKKRMFSAMKEKKTVEKELIRTVIGEVTATGEDPTDERVLAVLKKTMKGCQETLKHTTDETQRGQVEQELELLDELVPKGMSVDEIVTALAEVSDAVKAAGNDGQATGVAMKHLKASRANVDGKDVAAAVKQLRS